MEEPRTLPEEDEKKTKLSSGAGRSPGWLTQTPSGPSGALSARLFCHRSLSFIMLQTAPPLGPLFQELLVGLLRNICAFEGAIWQGWEKPSEEEIS